MISGTISCNFVSIFLGRECRDTFSLCAGHGKEVEDESSLQADLKRSTSLDKVILVREWLKEVDGKIRLERTETR